MGIQIEPFDYDNIKPIKDELQAIADRYCLNFDQFMFEVTNTALPKIYVTFSQPLEEPNGEPAITIQDVQAPFSESE